MVVVGGGCVVQKVIIVSVTVPFQGLSPREALIIVLQSFKSLVVVGGGCWVVQKVIIVSVPVPF